jgi:hypothetical protein
MSKKNEDSIERFFRKAVKQYDTPFMEGDWQKMEKMLDEEAIERAAIARAKHFRQAGFSLILLLLISSGVFFFTTVKNTKVSSVKNETSEQSLDSRDDASAEEGETKNPTAGLLSSTENSSTENDLSKREKKEVPVSTTLVPANDDNTTRIGDTESTAAVKTIKELNTGETVVQKQTERNLRKKQNVAALTNTDTQNKQDTLSNHEVVAGQQSSIIEEGIFVSDGREKEYAIPAAVHYEKSGSTVSKIANKKNNSQKGFAAKGDEKVSGPDTIVADVLKEELTLTDSVHSPEEQIEQVPSRWNVAVVVAPEFTSSVLGRYSTPGEAFGLTAGYRLFNRFTINIGFIRSTKKYEGFGSEYHPPEGYWMRKTNGVIPEEIAGTCVVYEVPVTLQYTLIQRGRSNVYIGAGVSSYIMASQRYKYSFGQSNPGAAQGWSTSESFSYPFNIGHFSLAYERQIFSKLAIGVEPYVKIPFAGMGWSDVELFSTGVFINLRYRFFRKERSIAVRDGN